MVEYFAAFGATVSVCALIMAVYAHLRIDRLEDRQPND